MVRLTYLTVQALFLLGFGIFFICLVSANDTTSFEVDINGPESAPPAVISVQVPDSIYLGEISVGDKTGDIRVDINNTGNTAIFVTPQLIGNSQIFENMYFKRVLSSSPYRIGEYVHNISAPSESGNGVRSSYMYAYLDLRDYQGDFDEDTTTRLSSDVKFFAVPQ